MLPLSQDGRVVSGDRRIAVISICIELWLSWKSADKAAHSEMCIILLAYKTHPRYQLILAANRDEFYARSTSRAAFWEDAPDVLAGRDLERRGTWLGVTKGGRIAAVTNFRDPSEIKKNAPSRGELVSDFLRSQESPENYLQKIAALSSTYNGFNLIVGNKSGIFYHSNRDDEIKAISPGVHGLSNHLLDTPWPKVEKGKHALSNILKQGGEISAEAIFDVLADDVQADDASLPRTGVSLEYERALSPIFISTPIYGTRSSTAVLIEPENSITFIERTLEPGNKPTDIRFKFPSGNGM